MSSAKVDVHELIAWDLDEYSYRDSAIGQRQSAFARQVEQAQKRLAERDIYAVCDASVAGETENIRDLLAAHARRHDLQNEYKGLDWRLGVVDIRRLLAFQRRLVFDTHHDSALPPQDEWHGLLSLALGSQRRTNHRVTLDGDASNGLRIRLLSANPDLQLRLTPKAGQNDLLPLSLYGGSPFFEVAELRGRWFLRDGYHRAYRLLQAGVYHVPAVVIRARTITEVGATESWFFREEQLFSDRPPQVMDFLDEHMVLRYERTALHKVIRIRIEESLEIFDETEDVQGETL